MVTLGKQSDQGKVDLDSLHSDFMWPASIYAVSRDAIISERPAMMLAHAEQSVLQELRDSQVLAIHPYLDDKSSWQQSEGYTKFGSTGWFLREQET